MEVLTTHIISVNLNSIIITLTSLLTFSILGNVVLSLTFIYIIRTIQKNNMYDKDVKLSDMFRGGSWRRRAIEKGLDKEIEAETGDKLGNNI